MSPSDIELIRNRELQRLSEAWHAIHGPDEPMPMSVEQKRDLALWMLDQGPEYLASIGVRQAQVIDMLRKALCPQAAQASL